MRQNKKLLFGVALAGAAAVVAGGRTSRAPRSVTAEPDTIPTPEPTPVAAVPVTPEPVAVVAPPAAPRKTSFRTTKRLLFAVMLIGIAAYFGFGGTFANFQAETANNGNAIASGTLTMSDQINSGTACFSYSAASADNINAGCGAAFAATNVAPGTFQTTQVAKITLQNSGSINGSNLYLYGSQTAGISRDGR